MFGLGLVKGLGITLKHFVKTYLDDLRYFPRSATNPVAFARRQGTSGAGLFTVEYPEMKLTLAENFRYLPFLVTEYDTAKDSPEYDPVKARAMARCTSCGICAKVCPPQCIWIVRANDPVTGKPVSQPSAFYIDTDICMNCGSCAEFCPFDAIKMDHDYELADYERQHRHVHDLARLLKPVSYYAAIRPTWYAQEEAAKRAAKEEKRRKAEEKQWTVAPVSPATQPAPEQPQPAAEVKPKRTPEEIKAQREAMLAQKRAKEGGEG